MILAALVALVLAVAPSTSTSTSTTTSTTATATPTSTPTSTSTPTATPPPRPRRIAGFPPPPIVLPAGAPRRVVLLLPDGAPGQDDDAHARALADDGALVVVLDTRAWREARAAAPRCAYPAGDLEVLAQQLEKERGLDAYQRPILVGLGEGAAVAWAAVAQAPTGTFAGAVLASPCPDRPLALKLCPGSGPKPRHLAGGDLPKITRALAPTEVIADPASRACPAAASARLAADLGARVETLERRPAPPAGGEPALGAALRAAVGRLPATAPAAPPALPVSAAPASVADLPLVEVPAAGDDPRLAILLTGDGGWVGADKALAGGFAAEGVATVGLDSLRYFWKRRTPAETTDAIARIIDHYGAAWRRTQVVLVGYSRGADIVPFVAARLPPLPLERLRVVAMIGPSPFAEFEVHAIDILSNVRRSAALDTGDAVRSTAGRTPMVCIRGSDEKDEDSLCPALVDLPWVKQVLRRGGHRLGGGERDLVRTILGAAR